MSGLVLSSKKYVEMGSCLRFRDKRLNLNTKSDCMLIPTCKYCILTPLSRFIILINLLAMTSLQRRFRVSVINRLPCINSLVSRPQLDHTLVRVKCCHMSNVYRLLSMNLSLANLLTILPYCCTSPLAQTKCFLVGSAMPQPMITAAAQQETEEAP